MFRVSGEVEYNLSVIPALCGQLRPRTTPCATQCHLHRVSAGVEEDCMDRQKVSEHRFMSEMEVGVCGLICLTVQRHVYVLLQLLQTTNFSSLYFSPHVVIMLTQGTKPMHSISNQS